MIFNKKAQFFGFLRVLAFALFFLVLFALGLAPFISSVLGVATLSNAGVYGGWLLGNFNLWIFLGFIIFIVGLLVWGFRE